MARLLGGEVVPAQEGSAREYGRTLTCYDTSSRLFRGLPEEGAEKALAYITAQKDITVEEVPDYHV